MTVPQSKTIVMGRQNSAPYLELTMPGKAPQQVMLEGDTEIRLGRDPEWATARLPDDWETLSRRHARLAKQAGRWWIYDGDGSKPSSNGLFANHQRVTGEGLALAAGLTLQIGQNPQTQIRLTFVDPQADGQTIGAGAAPRVKFVELAGRSTVIGRDPGANFPLDAPMISRQHAILEPDGRGHYWLTDTSTNGTFVNGHRVTGRVTIGSGTVIQVGPYKLLLDGDRLLVQDEGDRIRLDGLHLTLPAREPGKLRLVDVSLSIEPGQFVALVGGSGAGKSTLMKTLLGIERLSQPGGAGQVFLNGSDLQASYNIYRTQIGYVPQDDILFPNLTVYESLLYAARLRLPKDTSRGEIDATIGRTLSDIDMNHRQDALVKDLSGGQRKRVSIGVELLADPKLFMLDEPTSGLDPGLDRRMMMLLRKLAHQGRTVILVTHATGSLVECDRAAFMGRGGHLTYYGPPKEAFDFFAIDTGDFADIYLQLEPEGGAQVPAGMPASAEESAIHWASQFRTSPLYEKYITNHLSQPTSQFQQGQTQPSRPSFFGQLGLLIERGWTLMLRDRVNLGLALLTAPVAIALITLAVRDKSPLYVDGTPTDVTLPSLALRVLFVFTCAGLWVGLSGSAQELIKEATIYFRERLVNLGLAAYLGSKVMLLGGLAIVQAVTVMAVVLVGFSDPRPDLLPWPLGLWITTFLTLTASFCLGLAISSVVKNSSQANSALPLILLPQIIFSGVLFKMDGVAKLLSWATIARWSVGAYGSLVDVNGLNPAAKFLPNGEQLPQPFENTPVYEATWQNLATNWGVLLVHALVYLTVTAIVQKKKDVL